MTDSVPVKAEDPAPAPAPALPLPATSDSSLPTAAKKKAGYRPQKGGSAAVAEQILEAVAATKERHGAPKLGALKKTISASGYAPEKGAVVRPNQSANTLDNQGSPVESGAGTSSASLHPDREEEEGEEGEDGAKGGAKRKPARKRAAATKPAAHKLAKKSAAAKSPRKAKPRKAAKRPAASRTVRRERRAPKRR